MKNPNLSGWKCQAEYRFCGQNVHPSQIIDQIMSNVRGLGLEPAQVERIQAAILAVLHDPATHASQKSDYSTILIRLLVPLVNLDDPPCSWQVKRPDHRKESNGPGFFIFEKIAAGQGNPLQPVCREVNVLVYGH